MSEQDIAPLAEKPVDSLTTIELRAELRALGQNSAGSEPDLRRRLRDYLVHRAREDEKLLAEDEDSDNGGSGSDGGRSSSRHDKKHSKKKHKKKRHSKEKKRKKSKKRKKKHRRKRKSHSSSPSSSPSSSSSSLSSSDEKVEEKTYDASGRLIVVKKKKVSRKKAKKGKRWSDKLLRWVPNDYDSGSDNSNEQMEDMDIAHPILKRARHKLFGQGIGV